MTRVLINGTTNLLLALSLLAFTVARAKDIVDPELRNPIDVPGWEKIKVQQKKTYQSLDQIPSPQYIRKDIPPAKLPEIKGRIHEALVPDTCDLEDRARLAVNAITELAYRKADGEPYQGTRLDLVPPRVQLSFMGQTNYQQWIENLPLLRIMSGSAQNPWVDKAYAESILHSLGPDGLYYTPLIGRPWEAVCAQLQPEANKDVQRATLHLPVGEILRVLGLYYKLTGDEIWKDALIKMVDRMREITVIMDGKGVILESYIYPGYKLPPDAVEQAKATLKSAEQSPNCFICSTWLTEGMAQAYKITGYPPAKALAIAMTNTLRHNYFFKSDGSWHGHFHCVALGLLAMIETAEAVGDSELARFVVKAYEWAKNNAEMGSIPELGYFPVMQKQRDAYEPMEPCAIGDMVTLAAKLSRMGVADYYDDLDRFVRNGLIESQYARPDEIGDFTRKIQAGTAEGNSFWQPGKPGQELPGMVGGADKNPFQRPLAYNELADRLNERLTGYFSCGVFPNDKHSSPYDEMCCTGNCGRALYFAWESILTCAENGSDGNQPRRVDVNLLLNRTSPWLDIDSEIPYRGRVVINVKQPCRLRVRMNDWIDTKSLACQISGQAFQEKWEGRYADFGVVNSKQRVVLEFPIAERVVKLKTFKKEFTVIFKGNNVVSIEPRGGNVSTYQRDHYRSTEPRYIRQQRFICDQIVPW